MNEIIKLGVPKLFDILEKHAEWQSFYFSIENRFPSLSASVGNKWENMPKNRYCNVWPWNVSRVVLMGIPDYINASHIKSPIVHHKYIAAQVSNFSPTIFLVFKSISFPSFICTANIFFVKT